MRHTTSKDKQIKVERERARSLQDLMEIANCIHYNGCDFEQFDKLIDDFIELIDYLVERLDHADSERFK